MYFEEANKQGGVGGEEMVWIEFPRA